MGKNNASHGGVSGVLPGRLASIWLTLHRYHICKLSRRWHVRCDDHDVNEDDGGQDAGGEYNGESGAPCRPACGFLGGEGGGQSKRGDETSNKAESLCQE